MSARSLLLQSNCVGFLLYLLLTASSSAQDSAKQANFSPGTIRTAIAKQRALIAENPEDPERYIHLAYTFSDSGLGEMARDQARRATEVAPKSAFARSAQAWILRHNLIGVDFGRGSDYDASIASYRRAIELDPGDLDIRISLANALEHNRDGIAYAPDASVAEAIENYRYVKAHQSIIDPIVEDNLLIALFYSGQFKEVLDETATGSSTATRDGIAIAASAAYQGTPMAIASADRLSSFPKQRTAALELAAEGLGNMRLYPQAAALLAASIQEQGDSSIALSKIQIFRTLKPFDNQYLPATDPRSPIQHLIAAAIDGQFTDAIAQTAISRHAYPSEKEWQMDLKQQNLLSASVRTLSVKTGLPLVVIKDLILGTMKMVVEPSDEPGFRIATQSFGQDPSHFFVLKEDGVFKVVATQNADAAIGTEALYLLRHGQEAEARSILNWKREQAQQADADDPLSGSLFARIWSADHASDASSIEIAAAALLAENAASTQFLPKLVAERDKAPSGPARANLDLLLTHIYLHAQDVANARLTADSLLKQYPDSHRAIILVGRACRLQKDWSAWKAMLAPRITKQPNDRSLLLQVAEEAEVEGDYPRARQTLRAVLDSGRAMGNDYNTYAWLSLFDATPDTQDLESAQQANLLSKSSSFDDLHTLACVSAALGQTTEARQYLLQSMSAANLAEPDGAVWLGFGLIYEQYGIPSAAIAAYKRVDKPEDSIDPVDTFVLAQHRLKALHAS